MHKKALRNIVLGLVHQGRSYTRSQGLQGAFQHGAKMQIDVQAVLDELVADSRLEFDGSNYAVTQEGLRDLSRVNFDEVYQTLNPLSQDPKSFKLLVNKVVNGKPLPELDLSPKSFELSGKLLHTNPHKIADALATAVGQSHGSPKVQIVEDQILFDDGNFEVLVYCLAQAKFDDSIPKGQDNFRVKSTYKGTRLGLENLCKKFTAALDGHQTGYALDFFEVNEEGDILGDEVSFFS